MGKKGKSKLVNLTVNLDENAVEKIPIAVDKPTETQDLINIEDIEINATLSSKKNQNKKKNCKFKRFCYYEPIERNSTILIFLGGACKECNEVSKELENNSEKPSEATLNNSETIAVSDINTLKKKRNRNKKKSNVSDVENSVLQLKSPESLSKIEETSSIMEDKPIEGTLKKRKRNKNKKKKIVDKEELLEADNLETLIDDPIEAKSSTQLDSPKNDGRKGKNKKRSGSKKSILDELQEKQDREQQEAREILKNEIVKREKLLEKIDMVLDCKKNEERVAQDQQESLKDISMLASTIGPAQSQEKSEILVDKIEQVLGVTKLEIKNVQNHKVFVERLENELAKVKDTKDKYLRGEAETSTSSINPKIPEHIEKLSREIKNVKDVKPRKKEDLLKEIESRDVLMAEINKVLDTTKTEIEKVQKQQKIIANLETELHKIKEAEINEKLMEMTLEEEIESSSVLPPSIKQPTASSSLLDALMANVGKLKEAQALKHKDKEIQLAKHDSFERSEDQENVKQTEDNDKQKEEILQEKTKNLPAGSTQETPNEKHAFKKIDQIVDEKQSEKSSKPQSPIEKKSHEQKKLPKEKKGHNIQSKVDKKSFKELTEVTDASMGVKTSEEAPKVETPADGQQAIDAKALKKGSDNTVVVEILDASSLNSKISELNKNVLVESQKRECNENVGVFEEQVKIISSATESCVANTLSEHASEGKRNDKNKKTSPKNNKNYQPKKIVDKKNESDVSDKLESTKPSMAEMLKSAHFAQLEEIEKEKITIESSESPTDKEVILKGSEVLTSVKTELDQEEPKKPEINPTSGCKMEESSISVEESSNFDGNCDENEKISSKNVAGSGFVSHVEPKKLQQNDVEPLKTKEDKLPPGKVKTPVKKAPKKPDFKKSDVVKSKLGQNKASEIKKHISKPDALKMADLNSQNEPSKVSNEVSTTAFQRETLSDSQLLPGVISCQIENSAEGQLNNAKRSTSAKSKVIQTSENTNIGSNESSSSSRTPLKSGNVNPASVHVLKSKTPSPVKSPLNVTKSTTVITPQTPSQVNSAKPNTCPTATKPTIITNKKTTTQKNNVTKTPKSKAAPSSVTFKVLKPQNSE